ncbi:MAG: hypothetical protein WAL39_09355, partial [Xanthobacteraceae bacterium]
MVDHTHPLLTKRMGGALTVLVAGTGIGLALMSVDFVPLRMVGMAMALLGAGGAVSIYWTDFQSLRLRLVRSDKKDHPVYNEIWVVLIAIVLAILIPAFVWLHEAWPSVETKYRLTDGEKTKIIRSLATQRGQFVYVLSAANCEQCEEYAEEFRETIAKAPGWTAGGAPNIFGNASVRGIKLYTPTIKNPDALMHALADALNA